MNEGPQVRAVAIFVFKSFF